MRKRMTTINIAVLLALFAIAVSGCGDNDNTVINFDDCGNGVLDGNEECDDGNTSDSDGCLSTCVEASCGDGFVNVGTEACDGSNLAGSSCTSLGLGSGTLQCSTSCTFNTSGCGNGATPTPGPAATPTADGATATPGTGDTPTPAPTSTAAGGPLCGSGDTIAVALSINAGGTMLSGVNANISYPAAANIPGSINEQSVKDRVTFTPTGGLTEVNDEDTNSDLIDDRLTVSFVSTSAFSDGAFATVQFDCLEGSAAPASGAFTCAVVSASDDVGNPITASCALVVTGP